MTGSTFPTILVRFRRSTVFNCAAANLCPPAPRARQLSPDHQRASDRNRRQQSWLSKTADSLVDDESVSLSWSPKSRVSVPDNVTQRTTNS